jgi:catechol 2,3-dioxygenase-like lactoylglutathione lyase family enzyme
MITHLRQIALPSSDLSRSIRFYRDTLGATFVAEFTPPGLAFFQLGKTRLLLEHAPAARPSGAVLYFEVADINETYHGLKARGVTFDSPPHLIYRDDTGTFGAAGEEEWMAFFKDPDGNVLALASRVSANAPARTPAKDRA